MIPLVSQRSAGNTQTDQKPKTDVPAWRYRAESLEVHKNMTPAEVERRYLGVFPPKRPASLSDIYNSSFLQKIKTVTMVNSFLIWW